VSEQETEQSGTAPPSEHWQQVIMNLQTKLGTAERHRDDLLEALDHPFLREVLGYVEDCAPDEVMNALRLWQELQDAVLAQAEGRS
jgi:hypothetical protein